MMRDASPIIMHRVFIDESGTPDVFRKGVHQEHDKFFTMAAVVLAQVDYALYKDAMGALCEKYVKYLQGTEIKSNYIRCSNPKYIKERQTPEYIFYQFDDGQEQYDAFCADLKEVLQAASFQVISVTTNKEVAGQKFPHLPIHDTVLLNLWERISIFSVLNSNPRMRIVFDRTKTVSDQLLKESYQRFIQHGSWYFRAKNLAELKLDRDCYSCDSEDSIGLQLADLIAYPVKKQMEKGDHDFFQRIVRGKLHPRAKDNRNGKKIVMGNKLSLN